MATSIWNCWRPRLIHPVFCRPATDSCENTTEAIIGRPSKDDSVLSKEQILTLALEILDGGGAKALSFRALAKRLGVTPMAVTHHVGSRHQMLSDLIARVYEGVTIAPQGAAPKERLRFLLANYCRRVVAHPNVAQMIFADQSLFAGHVLELTDAIRADVAALVQTAKEAHTLVDLLVDYTHGFALSAASTGSENEQAPTIDDFHRGIGWILSRL